MRGILINAEDKTVSEVTLPDIDYSSEEPNYRANWDETRKLLLTTIVEPVRLGAVHLWVDEEGGLLKPEPGPFFRLGREGAWGPIISKRGLLLGCQGPEGDQSDFPFSLAKAQSLVDWLPEGTKFVEIETKEGTVDHPILGPTAAINRVSVFETPDGKRIEQ